MTAGFSLGPLVSGLLGQYGPGPTVVPYLLHAALATSGLVLATRLPETVVLRPADAAGVPDRGRLRGAAAGRPAGAPGSVL